MEYPDSPSEEWMSAIHAMTPEQQQIAHDAINSQYYGAVGQLSKAIWATVPGEYTEPPKDAILAVTSLFQKQMHLRAIKAASSAKRKRFHGR